QDRIGEVGDALGILSRLKIADMGIFGIVRDGLRTRWRVDVIGGVGIDHGPPRAGRREIGDRIAWRCRPRSLERPKHARISREGGVRTDKTCEQRTTIQSYEAGHIVSSCIRPCGLLTATIPNFSREGPPSRRNP